MDKKINKGNKKVMKMIQKLGFRSPYQVVVENDFVAALNRNMLRLKHVTNLFKSQPKLFITRCTYRKYEKDKKRKNDFSKYLEILNCGHETTKEPLQCLKKIMKKSNRNHYILGSNCPEITAAIGTQKKIPVLKCRKGTLILTADIEDITIHESMNVEADEEELNRLESLFPDEAEEELAT